MNYLSHIVLAKYGKKQIGAFVADAVKGSNYKKYEKGIQKGILQHRMVDFFIDNDKEVAVVTELFREKYGKYAGVVTDIVFDYYLIENWEKFQNNNLHVFIIKFYFNVIFNYFILPKRMKRFVRIVIVNNLFSYYKSTKGIKKILDLMAKYRGIPNHSDFVEQQINENYTLINNVFNSFFVRAQIKADEFL